MAIEQLNSTEYCATKSANYKSDQIDLITAFDKNKRIMFYNKKENRLFGLNRILYKTRDSTPSCNNMMIEE